MGSKEQGPISAFMNSARENGAKWFEILNNAQLVTGVGLMAYGAMSVGLGLAVSGVLGKDFVSKMQKGHGPT